LKVVEGAEAASGGAGAEIGAADTAVEEPERITDGGFSTV
jgi:hypothetical protein